MIIVLHGENSFLTKRKRDEIIAQYRTKHPQGLSYFVFEERYDLGDAKDALETVSLFETKRLVVFKDVLSGKKDVELLIELLKRKKIKEDKETVVMFSENEKIEVGKNKRLAWLLEKPSVVQESKNQSPAHVAVWIKQEVQQRGGQIDADALSLLASLYPRDMWRLASEIAKLVSYDRRVTKKNVELLVAKNAEGEVFSAIGALAAGDKKTAAREFHTLLKQGEDWTRLFAMIVFQFRSLLRVRSALEKSTDFGHIQKATGMHPFALRKTIPLAQKYTMEKLKEIYTRLLDTDSALKTGRTTFEAAVENLILRP